MEGTGAKDARDRALLLNGFAGGFRRSELVGIDRGDIETVRQGIVVHIRRSKTDQEGVWGGGWASPTAAPAGVP